MPALESLDDDADFSPFLSEGVSEALRKKALRKLFHLPQFNICDGLNDYDDDLSAMEPLGDTLTYQMKRWLASESDAEREPVAGDAHARAEADDGVSSHRETPRAERSAEQARSPDSAKGATGATGEAPQPADGNSRNPQV